MVFVFALFSVHVYGSRVALLSSIELFIVKQYLLATLLSEFIRMFLRHIDRVCCSLYSDFAHGRVCGRVSRVTMRFGNKTASGSLINVVCSLLENDGFLCFLFRL